MNPQPQALTQKTDLERRIGLWIDAFEAHLRLTLPTDRQIPEQLQAAMRYSVLDGGKRMRPLLVFASGLALEIEQERLLGIASAIELIHTYSLIHDDLPAMDDDDLRRGRPTSHRKFDEATAILAGDALQALAFEVLARDPHLTETPAMHARIFAEVAHACGAAGMAGGQVLDLAAIDQEITLEQLETMHRLKTGALIRASATTPALLAMASPDLTSKLSHYGDKLGLAFQIHDDVLDVTASSQQTGKPAQADAARNKPAFPSVIGVSASRNRASELALSAKQSLSGFPGDTSVLEWLADFTIHRAS